MGPGRNSGDLDTGIDIVCHDCTGANDSARTDPALGQDRCSRADDGTPAALHPATERYSRRDMDIVVKHAIMVDRRSRVDNAVIADSGSCIDGCRCVYKRAETNAGRSRNDGPCVNDGGKAHAKLGQLARYAGMNLGCANANDRRKNVAKLPVKKKRVVAKNRKSVNDGPGSHAGVDEPAYREAVRLACIGDDPAVPAAADYDNLALLSVIHEVRPAVRHWQPDGILRHLLNRDNRLGY